MDSIDVSGLGFEKAQKQAMLGAPEVLALLWQSAAVALAEG